MSQPIVLAVDPQLMPYVHQAYATAATPGLHQANAIAATKAAERGEYADARKLSNSQITTLGMGTGNTSAVHEIYNLVRDAKAEVAAAQEAKAIADTPLPVRLAVGAVYSASVGACAYHGYKRNQSVGWALWWALMGGLAPVVAPVIALAQGFGKPRAKANPGRKRRRAR